MKVVTRHGIEGLAGRYDASMLVEDYSRTPTPPAPDVLRRQQEEEAAQKKGKRDAV